MAVYRFVVALYKEHGIDTSSNKSERKIERSRRVYMGLQQN
jgi:hypothetical protein